MPISDALRTTNESETIEILRDVYVAGCNYTINKNLTFSSTNGATVTAMVKAVDNHTPGYENWTAEQIDEKNRDMVAFYIADGKTLTLDGVFLVINGNVDKDENGNEAGYDGTPSLLEKEQSCLSVRRLDAFRPQSRYHCRR